MQFSEFVAAQICIDEIIAFDVESPAVKCKGVNGRRKVDVIFRT